MKTRLRGERNVAITQYTSILMKGLTINRRTRIRLRDYKWACPPICPALALARGVREVRLVVSREDVVDLGLSAEFVDPPRDFVPCGVRWRTG